jgi:hypothetical protein
VFVVVMRFFCLVALITFDTIATWCNRKQQNVYAEYDCKEFHFCKDVKNNEQFYTLLNPNLARVSLNDSF